MEHYNFYAVLYNGKVYCTDCLPVSITNDLVTPIIATNTLSYIPKCCKCKIIFDYMNIINEKME